MKAKHQNLEVMLQFGEEFRIASKSSSELRIRGGPNSDPGHVLHPFLLAVHTNLAADGGATGAVTGCRTTELKIAKCLHTF